MIIVNLLPRVATVCVCTTDTERESVLEELHISPKEGTVRQLWLSDNERLSDSTRTALPLCDTLLTILETKAAQTLGTPRFECDWGGVCQWLKTLSEPVEIILEYQAVQQLNRGLPGGGQPTSLSVSCGERRESVLYDNQCWFEEERAA